MKKITIFCVVLFVSFFVNAQCTISPFIQQNYELDAKILALIQIRSDVNDPDYENPFVPDARVTPYLEQLSAIYNNPQNAPEIDSLFTQFQFHVNPTYGYVEPTAYKRLIFTVNTSVSWVQTFKDTGVSGITDLDNLMSQYQFSITNFLDLNSSGITIFYITTNYDFLNIRALIDDFEAISDVNYAEPDISVENQPLGINYSGIPYSIVVPVLPSGTQSYSVGVCDILVDGNGIYQFWLYGGDCLAGCEVAESRYVSISNDCSVVNFSRTLSNEEFQLTDIVIYPNPTSDKLKIQGITDIQQLEIYSVLGTTINIPLATSQNTLNVSSLKNGVYFLKVTDAQNRVAIRKFIKK